MKKGSKKSIFKEAWIFFSTLPNAAHAATMLSIVILAIKYMWLDNHPAPYEFIYKGGKAFEAILLSVIASYVFYIFVVHIEKHQRKKHSSRYISLWIHRTIYRCDNVLEEAAKQKGKDLPEKVSQQDVEDMFSGLKTYTDGGPMIEIKSKNKITWINCLAEYSEQSKEYLEKLFNHSEMLSPKLINTLLEIEDAAYFMIVDFAKKNQAPQFSDLAFISDAYYTYYSACQKAKELVEKDPWLETI